MLPSEVAQELDQPLKDLDALLSVVDTQVALGNAKLEHRLLSIRKSRLLLDRINEALTVLRHKPGNGELMYNIIFRRSSRRTSPAIRISCTGWISRSGTITGSASRRSTSYPSGCGRPRPAVWMPGWSFDAAGGVMSYSAAEKWQKIGKVGADDKGSADVLSCYRPKVDLTAGSRLEVIENSRFEAALCCKYDEKEGSKWQRTRAGRIAG